MVLYGLSRPGKLLLPGSCLLGPASSSCRGARLECLVFSWRFLGGPRRGVLQLPVHKSGVLRYPYFSTPTGGRRPRAGVAPKPRWGAPTPRVSTLGAWGGPRGGAPAHYGLVPLPTL